LSWVPPLELEEEEEEKEEMEGSKEKGSGQVANSPRDIEETMTIGEEDIDGDSSSSDSSEDDELGDDAPTMALPTTTNNTTATTTNNTTTTSDNVTNNHHNKLVLQNSDRDLSSSFERDEKQPTAEVLFKRIRTEMIERGSTDVYPQVLHPASAPVPHHGVPKPGPSPDKKRMFPHLRAGMSGTGLSQSATALHNMSNSISAPNINDVLHCMATAIFYHLKSGHDTHNKIFFEIFDERQHPISNEHINFEVCPTVDEVYGFINKIFTVEKLPTEVAILGLAYMERLISLTTITIHVSNWRRVIMAALILASKVWEDLAVWNVDFITVFPAVTVSDLNTLENNLLHLLKYDAGVTRQYYAQYYFALRDLAQENKRAFPLGELDKNAAARLEQNSTKTSQRVQHILSRTKSSEALVNHPIHGHGVLNSST